MLDCVALEMRMAIMAQRELVASAFDVKAAERVRGELQQEVDTIQSTIRNPLHLCTWQGVYTQAS